jgi:hypothetical protein
VSIAEPVRAVVEALGRAMVGDFRGAAEQIKGVPTVITSVWTLDGPHRREQPAHPRAHRCHLERVTSGVCARSWRDD